MKRKKETSSIFCSHSGFSTVLAALTLLLRLIDQAGAQMMQRVFSRSRSWVLALWIEFKKNNNEKHRSPRITSA